MKKFLLALTLAGCAHTLTAEDKTDQLLAQTRCEDWVDAHGYQLFRADTDGSDYVCRVMSPNVPDMWDVRLPK